MKYIYVVTRIMSEVKKGVVEIPNLGVHTSYRKAKKHYDSVVDDRKKSTNGHYRYHSRLDDRVSVLHEDNFYLIGETVRLERWAIQENKKASRSSRKS